MRKVYCGGNLEQTMVKGRWALSKVLGGGLLTWGKGSELDRDYS